MSEDIELVRGEKIKPAGSDGRMELLTWHEGTPEDRLGDQRKDYDQWVAKRIMEILQNHYPGYFWKVVADSKKGIVHFSLPILMGPTWCYVVKWEDLTPQQVMRGGGELLERLKLPRAAMDLGLFLEARGKAIARNCPKLPD